ncbi:hypothetical protein SAMN05216475_4719 [Pseudomonas synxantha]|uniref:Permease of the major facilitator superfamily n=2 Tax=Pseudomonas TaxID=286 RepID=A0AAX3IE08_9PSED|nr:hypothetical protein [Pseudomonas synxantha]SDU56614.1 hypothetical protein SAMN05216475_4719 [Pseudomonas synxantha]VTR04710.1 Uncharacterised protein [Pseudomonas synxantha]
MSRMLKISLKLGTVMKSEFLEKYVLVSFKPFLVGLALGLAFLCLKFDSFVEANASFPLISWGAFIGAVCMLVALLFGSVKKNTFKQRTLDKIIELTNYFVGVGLSSLAFCIIYYSRSGLTTGVVVMCVGGIAYWLGINRAFYQISNIEMSERDRVILWIFSFVMFILLILFFKEMHSVGRI